MSDPSQSRTGAARPRPLVGITCRRWPARLLGRNVVSAMVESEVDLHFTDYPRAIAAAGGLPVGLTRDAPSDEVLRRLDALVLSGGADIDPALYGEDIEPGCGDIERERDVWELELVTGAIERSIPVFGICRGLQVLNVVRGGTLVQDVPACAGDGHPRFDRPRAEIAHDVSLLPGSLAASVYGARQEVNSLHHQVVDRIGGGLVASGHSPDGTVEALELPGRPVLAVQWHPEALHKDPDPGLQWLVREASAASMGASV